MSHRILNGGAGPPHPNKNSENIFITTIIITIIIFDINIITTSIISIVIVVILTIIIIIVYGAVKVPFKDFIWAL